MSLLIFPRKNWAWEEPCTELPRLKHPARYAFFVFPNKNYLRPFSKPSPGSRPTFPQLIKEARFLRKGDVKRYMDIRYNFMIGPGGWIFEGRGWYKQPRLPQKFYGMTAYSIYVAYMGDFLVDPPPEDLYETRKKLMQYATENNFVSKQCLEISMACKYKRPPTENR